MSDSVATIAISKVWIIFICQVIIHLFLSNDGVLSIQYLLLNYGGITVAYTLSIIIFLLVILVGHMSTEM